MQFMDMKQAIHLIILMAVLTMMVGCTGDGYTPELRGIDTLIDNHPDSALALLDSLRTEKNGWSKARRMRYDLLTAKAQNKAFVDFTTDSIAKDFTITIDMAQPTTAYWLTTCWAVPIATWARPLE